MVEPLVLWEVMIVGDYRDRWASDGRPAGWFTVHQGHIYEREATRAGAGSIVEVGTWLGRSLSFIKDICMEHGTTVWCIDTWAGSPTDQTARLAQEGDVYDAFMQNVQDMGVESLIHVLRRPSADAAHSFPDGSIDLVMIDADHRYESVRQDIDAWLPKVKLGGTIMGHDYNPRKWPGVVRAVRETWDEFAVENRIWIVRTRRTAK